MANDTDTGAARQARTGKILTGSGLLVALLFGGLGLAGATTTHAAVTAPSPVSGFLVLLGIVGLLLAIVGGAMVFGARRG